MAPKTGSDLEEIRALLAEVKALREDVELKGAELRSSWGADADKSKVPPRVLNLSHYIALRAHDLTELQYRLAARGLSSLGRSESHVAQALDALIATLKRLSGESSAPYPLPTLARAGAAELEAEADRLFGKRQKNGPRARIMATLPPEAVEPEFVDKLVAAGMDCARINCAHDDPEMWGQMIENVRGAAARLERPCRVLMDIAGPKCRILRVKAPPKTRLLRGDRIVLIDELREKTKEPIAFSLNFPELVDQLSVGSELFIDDGKAAARVVSKSAGRAELEVYAAREKGVRLKPGKGVNFPSTELDLPPLTSKDFRDLDFIAEHADLIGYSFVQRVDDIELLQDHLVARAPKREPPGLVLKIETPLAVRNLPLPHPAVGRAQSDRGDDCAGRPRGRARLRQAHRNAGGNPVALRGGAHAGGVGDAGARQLCARRRGEPRRDDRRGDGSRRRMRDAQQGAVSRRRRRFPARCADPHGSPPRQEIRPLPSAQAMGVSSALDRRP